MTNQRKRKYYFVRNGWGNQHGTDIEEVMMTKAEYQAEQEISEMSFMLIKMIIRS